MDSLGLAPAVVTYEGPVGIGLQPDADGGRLVAGRRLPLNVGDVITGPVAELREQVLRGHGRAP